MNDTGNRIITAIIVVLVVIGAWYLGTTLKSSAGKPATSTTTGTTSNTNSGKSGGSTQGAAGTSSAGAVTVGGEAVSVADQPAGSSVEVKSVTIAAVGWVAVRDSAGKTLGAGLVQAGTHEAVQVPLLRNTESGQTYQVLLYEDDGDKTFDLHKDTLVMNSDGTVAGASFTATK